MFFKLRYLFDKYHKNLDILHAVGNDTWVGIFMDNADYYEVIFENKGEETTFIIDENGKLEIEEQIAEMQNLIDLIELNWSTQITVKQHFHFTRI